MRTHNVIVIFKKDSEFHSGTANSINNAITAYNIQNTALQIVSTANLVLDAASTIDATNAKFINKLMDFTDDPSKVKFPIKLPKNLPADLGLLQVEREKSGNTINYSHKKTAFTGGFCVKRLN